MNTRLMSRTDKHMTAAAEALTAEQIVPQLPAWWIALIVSVVALIGLGVVQFVDAPAQLKSWLPWGLLPVYAVSIYGIIQSMAGWNRIASWKRIRTRTNGWDLMAEEGCSARAGHELDESMPVQLQEEALKDFRGSLQKCLDDRWRSLLLISLFISLLPILCFALVMNVQAFERFNQLILWLAVGITGATITWFTSMMAISTGRSAITEWYDAACLRAGIEQKKKEEKMLEDTNNKPVVTPTPEPEDEFESVLSQLPKTEPPDRKKKTGPLPDEADDDVVVDTSTSNSAFTSQPQDIDKDTYDAGDGDDYLGDDPLKD